MIGDIPWKLIAGSTGVWIYPDANAGSSFGRLCLYHLTKVLRVGVNCKLNKLFHEAHGGGEKHVGAR